VSASALWRHVPTEASASKTGAPWCATAIWRHSWDQLAPMVSELWRYSFVQFALFRLLSLYCRLLHRRRSQWSRHFLHQSHHCLVVWESHFISDFGNRWTVSSRQDKATRCRYFYGGIQIAIPINQRHVSVASSRRYNNVPLCYSNCFKNKVFNPCLIGYSNP